MCRRSPRQPRCQQTDKRRCSSPHLMSLLSTHSEAHNSVTSSGLRTHQQQNETAFVIQLKPHDIPAKSNPYEQLYPDMLHSARGRAEGVLSELQVTPPPPPNLHVAVFTTNFFGASELQQPDVLRTELATGPFKLPLPGLKRQFLGFFTTLWEHQK